MKSINPKEMSNENTILKIAEEGFDRLRGYIPKMISDGNIGKPIGTVTIRIPKMKEDQNAVL